MKKQTTEKFSYKCLKVAQRIRGGPCFVLFSAKAGQILKWAAIDRFTSNSQAGPQRIEKPYKVRAIKSFFEVNANNTIPTAVVIGFRPKKVKISKLKGHDQFYELNFSVLGGDKDVATIVDGQHRVLGVSSYNADLLLNVVGLLDVDDTETAFQFLVINNKAAKVSADHLRALALHYREQDLEERLRIVRLNLNPNLRFVGYANELDESPFKGILTLPNNRKNRQIVPPAAIEDSINYLRAQRLPELADDDDMVLSIYFTMWSVVKSKWTKLWNAKSKLLNKVSIVCMSQFFVDHLLREFDWSGLDLFDPDAVETEITRMLEVLSPEFWAESTEWTSKGLDTQAGRKLFLEALEQMVRNNRKKLPWQTDVTMISQS